jgi:putative membrane protein
MPRIRKRTLNRWHKNSEERLFTNTTINMKTKNSFSILLFAVLYTIACNNTDSSQQTVGESANKDSAAENIPNHPAPDNTARDTANQLPATGNIDPAPLDTKTGNFATEAAGGGMMEVTLGQTAQQQGMSQRVKDYGAMMVADHTKANNELKAIAGAKNFTLPSALPEKHQHHVDDLSKKQGKDFDEAYIKMMVSDHEKDIKEFQKAAKSAADTTVKSFAARTLPTLKKHLDSARAIYRGQ